MKGTSGWGRAVSVLRSDVAVLAAVVVFFRPCRRSRARRHGRKNELLTVLIQRPARGPPQVLWWRWSVAGGDFLKAGGVCSGPGAVPRVLQRSGRVVLSAVCPTVWSTCDVLPGRRRGDEHAGGQDEASAGDCAGPGLEGVPVGVAVGSVLVRRVLEPRVPVAGAASGLDGTLPGLPARRGRTVRRLCGRPGGRKRTALPRCGGHEQPVFSAA